MGWFFGGLFVLLLSLSPVQAATLGIPTPYTTLSGIGVISGWKCEAGDLTIRFNEGMAIPLLHGAYRPDVLEAGACPHAEVGFLTIMNWGELGDGTHTAVVYDDGVEFDRATFDVVTTGEAYLRGAAGQCVVPDFPAPNEAARFIWNQPTQHLELAEVGGAELLPIVEVCEETVCPTCEVCEVCQETVCPTCEVCPTTPPERTYEFYGTWTFTLHNAPSSYIGCDGPSTTYSFNVASLTVQKRHDPTHPEVLSSQLIFNNFGRFEGSIRSTAGVHDLSVRGHLSSRWGDGYWFDNYGCGGQLRAAKE